MLTKKADFCLVIQSAKVSSFAVEGVEQHHAAQPVGEAAVVRAPGRRHVAAAVGDDDDRHAGKRPDRARVAVQLGQVLAASPRKRANAPGCHSLPALESAALSGELRRHQRGVDAGGGNLRGHLLAQIDVVGELGAVAVEEHDQQARPANVESLRQVQQHLAVVVGFILPIDATRSRAVAAPAILDDVEEWPAGARHEAIVGERAPCRTRRAWISPAPGARTRECTRWGIGHGVGRGSALGWRAPVPPPAGRLDQTPAPSVRATTVTCIVRDCSRMRLDPGAGSDEVRLVILCQGLPVRGVVVRKERGCPVAANRVGNVGLAPFCRQRIRVRRPRSPIACRRADGLVDAHGLSS